MNKSKINAVVAQMLTDKSFAAAVLAGGERRAEAFERMPLVPIDAETWGALMRLPTQISQRDFAKACKALMEGKLEEPGAT